MRLPTGQMRSHKIMGRFSLLCDNTVLKGTVLEDQVIPVIVANQMMRWLSALLGKSSSPTWKKSGHSHKEYLE